MPAIGCGAFLVAAIALLVVNVIYPPAAVYAFWIVFGAILASGVYVGLVKPKPKPEGEGQ